MPGFSFTKQQSFDVPSLPGLCFKSPPYPGSSRHFLRAVSQSDQRCCVLGCSSQFCPPNKTSLSTFMLYNFFFFQSTWDMQCNDAGVPGGALCRAILSTSSPPFLSPPPHTQSLSPSWPPPRYFPVKRSQGFFLLWERKLWGLPFLRGTGWSEEKRDHTAI